jgi:hypothetical protein
MRAQINVRTTWKSQLNLGNANEFTNLTVKTPHLITHWLFPVHFLYITLILHLTYEPLVLNKGTF